MNRVTVTYLAQIKRAAGCAVQTVEVPAEATLIDLLRRLAEVNGPAFADLILTPQGAPNPSLLFFIDEVPFKPEQRLPENAGVTILAPMAGG